MAFSPARNSQKSSWRRGVRHRGFALRSRSVELIRGTNHFGDSVRLRIDSNESTPRPKIFCIGMNKTGTTSLMVAAGMLGISCGDQRIGELLFRSPLRRTNKMKKIPSVRGLFSRCPVFPHINIPVGNTHLPKCKIHSNRSLITRRVVRELCQLLLETSRARSR